MRTFKALPAACRVPPASSSLPPLCAHEMMMRWNATGPWTARTEAEEAKREGGTEGRREWRFRCGVTPSLCYNVTSKRTRKCKPILGWALLLPLPSSLSGAEDGEHLAETGFMALRLCLCGSPSRPFRGRLTRLKVMNMVILVIAQLAAAAATPQHRPHIHTTTTYAPSARCNLTASDGWMDMPALLPAERVSGGRVTGEWRGCIFSASAS